ncbi:hypothetical protein [Branchiibius hedensis]|uniref:hypothetical protein n=1 Tax=Branchiibius hedensis TaxID=672460 RepID=UPI001474CA2F|nr:hypothetical protein [Branchiibius hedensis]
MAAELADAPPAALMVRFASFTGLRAGEMTGLQIRDVNLFKRTVSVERTVQRIRGEWVTGTPKSLRSRRTVPILHPGLLDDLAAFLAEHPARTDPAARLWPGREPGTHPRGLHPAMGLGVVPRQVGYAVCG